MIPPHDHTWNIFLHYHRCANCGYVFENRSDYRSIQEREIKELSCPRCDHQFSVERIRSEKRKPLFGKPQPPEVDWS